MATKKVNFFVKVWRVIVNIATFLAKFIKLFLSKWNEPDKIKHLAGSMALLYYFGTMNYFYATVQDGKIVPFIQDWILWVLMIGGIWEILQFVFGNLFKLREKFPIIGFADWWDFLFDWMGIMIGLILIWIGQLIINWIF